MTVLSVRPVVVGVKNALIAVTGKPVGDTRAPLPIPPAALPVMPYAIVTGGGAVVLDGPPLGDDRFGDGHVPIDVTCVGEEQDQAEWMADAVRLALVDRDGGHFVNPIEVFGFSVGDRDYLGSSPPIYEGSVVNIVEAFVFWLTPRL